MSIAPERLNQSEGRCLRQAEQNLMLTYGCLKIQVLEVDFEFEDVEVAVLIELEACPP